LIEQQFNGIDGIKQVNEIASATNYLAFACLDGSVHVF
jgi:hypothetical protein